MVLLLVHSFGVEVRPADHLVPKYRIPIGHRDGDGLVRELLVGERLLEMERGVPQALEGFPCS